MSVLHWLSNEKMARLEPFFPKCEKFRPDIETRETTCGLMARTAAGDEPVRLLD